MKVNIKRYCANARVRFHMFLLDACKEESKKKMLVLFLEIFNKLALVPFSRPRRSWANACTIIGCVHEKVVGIPHHHFRIYIRFFNEIALFFYFLCRFTCWYCCSAAELFDYSTK